MENLIFGFSPLIWSCSTRSISSWPWTCCLELSACSRTARIDNFRKGTINTGDDTWLQDFDFFAFLNCRQRIYFLEPWSWWSQGWLRASEVACKAFGDFLVSAGWYLTNSRFVIYLCPSEAKVLRKNLHPMNKRILLSLAEISSLIRLKYRLELLAPMHCCGDAEKEYVSGVSE